MLCCLLLFFLFVVLGVPKNKNFLAISQKRCRVGCRPKIHNPLNKSRQESGLFYNRKYPRKRTHMSKSPPQISERTPQMSEACSSWLLGDLPGKFRLSERCPSESPKFGIPSRLYTDGVRVGRQLFFVCLMFCFGRCVVCSFVSVLCLWYCVCFCCCFVCLLDVVFRVLLHVVVLPVVCFCCFLFVCSVLFMFVRFFVMFGVCCFL